jgi:hypothetical protein
MKLLVKVRNTGGRIVGTLVIASLAAGTPCLAEDSAGSASPTSTAVAATANVLEASTDVNEVPEDLKVPMEAFAKNGIQVKELDRLRELLVSKGAKVCLEKLGDGVDVPPQSAKRSTVKEILDYICETGKYRYEVRGTIVNLYPSRALELGEQYPLNRRVASLALHDTSVEDAVEKLSLATGEELGILQLTGTVERAPKISLTIENMTVREALNRILSAAGLKYWTSFVMELAPQNTVDGQAHYYAGLIIN